MKKYLTIDRVLMILTIIFLLGLNKCSSDYYQLSMSKQQLENQKIDSIKNKYGETILTQEAIITNNKDDIANLSDSIFRLKDKHNRRIKELIAFYSTTSNTGIRDVAVPYLDKKAMKRFTDSVEQRCAEVIKFYRDSAIQVPKTVKDSSAYFVFQGTVEKDSFRINNIQFPDSQYIRVAKVKKGLFKKPVYEIQMFHTNPYVKTTGLNSVIYKPPKQNKLPLYAVLVALGLVAGKSL